VYLIYLDESGNTGLNLNDPAQPVFVLCAMAVAEEVWQPLEHALAAAVTKHFPVASTDPNFEVHASELRSGSGPFRGMSVSDRVIARDVLMDIGKQYGIRLIHRAIEKKRYAAWQSNRFGSGIQINLHVPAFVLVSRCVDDYLLQLPGTPRGILISDENKEIVADIEKSIRVLRSEVGPLRLSQIIEKGFFIDSRKSLPLQLCDLYSMSLRKHHERVSGATPKTIDDSGIERALGLCFKGDEKFVDVTQWLSRQHTQP
jgi:hypothetical protein